MSPSFQCQQTGLSAIPSQGSKTKVDIGTATREPNG
jgi:hypothetical protein